MNSTPAKPAKRGRRPKGNIVVNARADILQAALQEFAQKDYNHVTLRVIAKKAHVDPALIYHYFQNKEDLFVETMRNYMNVPTDEELPPDLPLSERIQRTIELFLVRWGSGGSNVQFMALLRSISSNPKASAQMRRLFEEQLTPYVAATFGGKQVALRVALIASTLLGLGVVRDLIRLEPLASASLEDIASWVGPTFLRYLTEVFP